LEMFNNVLASTQECPEGPVVIAFGSCCLVKDEDCWYRAEIVKVGEDKKAVQLFLLDYGKTVESSVDKLRPLPDEFVAVPGLVIKVNLIGIKPVGKDWSVEELGGAEMVLDVGKDTTQFVVKVQDVNAGNQCLISMKDAEANDVAQLMIDIGIAANEEPNKDPLEYKAGSLSIGNQTVVILNAVSPMQLYVCTIDMFMELSSSMSKLEEEAAESPAITCVELGDVVLVCDEGTWYRGKVRDIEEDKVTVELVDIGSEATVGLANLKVGSSNITKDAVNAVSCCLDSWIGEDKTLAAKNWGCKMGEIVEPYSEMEIEVVEQCDNGQFRIRVPGIEKKLKGNEVKSRAEMLKDKLRKK